MAEDFPGQEEAIRHLKAALATPRARGARKPKAEEVSTDEVKVTRDGEVVEATMELKLEKEVDNG